jgi:hypothetical protein
VQGQTQMGGGEDLARIESNRSRVHSGTSEGDISSARSLVHQLDISHIPPSPSRIRQTVRVHEMCSATALVVRFTQFSSVR